MPLLTSKPVSKERKPYALAGNTPLHTEPADRMSGRDGGQGSPAADTPLRRTRTAGLTSRQGEACARLDEPSNRANCPEL